MKPDRTPSVISRLTSARPLHHLYRRVPVRVWLTLLLGFYVLAAGAFSVITPIFEAPDEHHHYFTARYIAQHQQLPIAQAGTRHRQEGAQPPLYYLLAATLTLPWPIAAEEADLALNPEAQTGTTDAANNHNLFLHPPHQQWPWRGHVLLVHLLRFSSVLTGAGSLLCIYATARMLWRGHPHYALLAVALTAALPQWLFLHSAITNDTLLIFLVCLTHCYLTYLWVAPLQTHRYWLLGLLVALAVLTKNTGLLFLPYGAIFLLAKHRWRINRSLLTAGAAVAIPVLLLISWHFWRNLQLYGDLTAISAFVELGGGERQLPAWFILQHLELLWLSTIAFFGWMNVLAPRWVFVVWVVLFVCAVVGALMSLWRGAVIPRRLRRGIAFWQWAERRSQAKPGMAEFHALFVLWPVLVFAAWFSFNLRTPAEQGRLLFPAIIPIALWLGYGLGQWRPRLFPALGIAAAMITAIYCVAIVMPEAYPRLKTLPAPPADAFSLKQPLGLGIELVAAQAHTPELHPGDEARFTLYWRATEEIKEPPLLSPEVLGRELRPVGALPPAYHGGGMFPASFWPTERIIAEELRITVAKDAPVPSLGRLYLRLQGQEAFVHAATVKITPRTWPAATPTVMAEFAGGIAIAQAAIVPSAVSPDVTFPGSTVPVRVRWQISEDVQAPLNTFVHLGLPGEPPLVQADGPALGGDYPADYWGAGEVFDDEYLLILPHDLPFGEYAVMIGLYNRESGERIPLSINGERQAAGAFTIDWVTVVQP